MQSDDLTILSLKLKFIQ